MRTVFGVLCEADSSKPYLDTDSDPTGSTALLDRISSGKDDVVKVVCKGKDSVIMPSVLYTKGIWVDISSEKEQLVYTMILHCEDTPIGSPERLEKLNFIMKALL